MISVVNQQGLPGQGHVPGQGMVINRQGMARIEIAIDPGGAKQGIVMDVAEIEDIILDEINGAGVGPGQPAGLEEHLSQ